MKSISLVILAMMLAVLPVVAGEDVVDHAGQRYRVVVAGPGAVRVLWKNEAGDQIRTFTEARAYCTRNGIKPGMLMNGGISQMWTAGMEEKPSNPFGTIIAVDGGE